jgi:hypothetical protein
MNNDPSGKQNAFSYFVTAAGILLCAVLLLTVLDYRKTILENQQKEQALMSEIAKLKTVIDSSAIVAGLSEHDIALLKQRGLKNPAADIAYDLVNNRGFILHEASFEKEIGFYFRSNVQILTPQWVLADFDNGQMCGKVILEYSVTDDGRIAWKVINSSLENNEDARRLCSYSSP